MIKVRQIIDTHYPHYAWYGRWPASECAAFNTVAGEWGIFGNFSPTPLTIEGVEFCCAEQLFQMMKFHHPEALRDIYAAKGQAIKMKAKKWGKTHLREDWPQMLVDALKFCLMKKYEQSAAFREALTRSQGLHIVEDETTRRSTSYGMQRQGDDFVGANLLGRLLTELRDNGTLEYHLPEDALQFIERLKP